MELLAIGRAMVQVRDEINRNIIEGVGVDYNDDHLMLEDLGEKIGRLIMEMNKGNRGAAKDVLIEVAAAGVRAAGRIIEQEIVRERN